MNHGSCGKIAFCNRPFLWGFLQCVIPLLSAKKEPSSPFQLASFAHVVGSLTMRVRAETPFTPILASELSAKVNLKRGWIILHFPTYLARQAHIWTSHIACSLEMSRFFLELIWVSICVSPFCLLRLAVFVLPAEVMGRPRGRVRPKYV